MVVSFDEDLFQELYPIMKNDDLAALFGVQKRQILRWRRKYGLRKSYQSHKNATVERFNDPRYQEWRLGVLRRDGFKCQKCGKPAKDKRVGIGLDCHHIASWARYPALRFTVDNGMSLCRMCHKQIHHELRRKRRR